MERSDIDRSERDVLRRSSTGGENQKVFDEFKNKFCEKKSWASSAIAKTHKARLICLTHNLMVLMEEVIRKKSGVINVAEFKRRGNQPTKEKKFHSLQRPEQQSIINNRTERLSQRTVKFIRWLKSHLDLERNWEESVARLAKVYSRS